MVKEVTILGRGPSRIGLLPSGILWAMNDLYRFQVDIDCLFLLHDMKYHTGLKNIDCASGGDIKEIKKCGIKRLIGVEEIKEHGIEAYPMQKIIDEFGVKQYYCDTVDYMMALAIYEGYEKINLIGIDYLPADVLHSNSRDSSLFWIGVAVGRKIDVVITDLSTLCKLKPYQSGNYMYDTFDNPVPAEFTHINGRAINEKVDYIKPKAIKDKDGNVIAILKDKRVQSGQSYY